MTGLRILGVILNVVGFLWYTYETFVVAGLFGPAPSHFPMEKDFGLYLIATIWLAGNLFWVLIEVIAYVYRRRDR